MKIQVINKTSTAGHQEQEKKEKPTGQYNLCVWGVFSGKLQLSLQMRKRENSHIEVVQNIRKSHVQSWTLNNNLKSHFRRVDFFPPHLLKHLPDYTDKIILCNSLWLLFWGCKHKCKVPSAFHLKGTQRALQVDGRPSTSSSLLNTIPAEDSSCFKAAGIPPYSRSWAHMDSHPSFSLIPLKKLLRWNFQKVFTIYEVSPYTSPPWSSLVWRML